MRAGNRSSWERQGRKYVEGVIRSGAALLLYRCNAPVRKTCEIPSTKIQNQSTFLNWETVRRPMPVVKLLPICDNQCSSSMACSSSSLSPAQATMLDPIETGLRIIRLGYSRFTVENRSLPIRPSARNQCDPDFSVRALRSSTSVASSFACKEPM